MIAPTPLGNTGDSMMMTLRSSMARRSSLGVPVSTLIFPRSAADRSEANKLTKAMEDKFGFHYVTNSFTQDPLVELDFQAYYTETNLAPALYASLVCWVIWSMLTTPDWVGFYDDDPDVRAASALRLWVSIFIYIPVPTLVACCRSRYFIGHEQTLLCLIAHCFAAGILGQGLIKADDYTRYFLKDLNSLFSLAFHDEPFGTSGWTDASMSADSSDAAMDPTINATIVSLDGSTDWWIYRNLQSSGRDLVLTYINRVAIPMVHLNMNLLRPLVVLLVAPLFKLDAFHYLLLAFSINLEFCILVSVQYPDSRSTIFVVNKFLLVFTLVCVSAVLVIRVRQTDRFLRLNFLHAKIVEERARASHLQKEIILNENKSLKKMLEERVGGHGDGSPPLDFDSPMAKVLLDLKALQRATELSPELRENLDGIVTLLMRKGQNLFAPDIHEQLKMKRDGDLDGDIKSWATTVLANKSYTRNRRASAVFQNSAENSASGNSASGTSSAAKDSERSLTAGSVGELMERDGWSVDTFEVAQMTNNKPITFITYIAFEQHNLFELCSVNKSTLANFLHFLDIGYHRNPYHNNCHAADVVSSVEYLISVMDNGYLQDLLTYQEVFAAIVAAAIHDFRHPGKNNNFMIKSGSDLAIEFSDSSVLERMHLAEAFFLTKDPIFNIFVGLSPGQYSEVRKAIVEMVLSTDLTVHLQLVGSLKTALISQEDSEVEHSPMLLMKIVIKCADLGHSSKALKLHARWSDLIIEEFFLQGDDEHTLGMDISPFMNRNSENSARNQVGFFEFIVLPFFEVVAEAVFRPEFKTILDQAHQNYKLWKKADNMQINSIKDILDQVLDPEAAKIAAAAGKAPTGH
ncbi:putative calcium/calmodulin-dependent 3',5'-cyclic nucleotide phosphodiesterase [Phytophthora cinnamomi]|uniref:putative calcium/calmodulin-dependent 3',5'-cyclic nucleotide phosphodiesterase n=1 Tax=Phytophthora cinnamomi TaxID=4785 RepID=UPI003559F5BC|nr:putative calcium/calmodulin-dependent 3',5'-cyclic nucleotide phosphodiesterase [Phytophthora cinnamomi]